jgi:hypothetical protein
MPVWPRGQRVEIAEEEAIILWDADTGTEHFIRRAAFKTKAKDFGFLVPTPSKPTLAEAKDRAFTRLAQWTAPPPPRGGPGGIVVPGGGVGGGSVVVVEKKRVAGLDAVVLQADDAEALNRWLKDNDYPSRPEYTDWLKPYVEKKWMLTAFKFAQGADPREIATQAVRMSFKTPTPFFPYREPKADAEGEKSGSRLLRVYLVGAGEARGTLGQGTPWPGKRIGGIKLPAAQRKELLNLLDLPASTLPEGAFATRFDDRSSPRPGTEEVFFTFGSATSTPKPGAPSR